LWFVERKWLVDQSVLKLYKLNIFCNNHNYNNKLFKHNKNDKVKGHTVFPGHPPSYLQLPLDLSSVLNLVCSLLHKNHLPWNVSIIIILTNWALSSLLTVFHYLLSKIILSWRTMGVSICRRNVQLYWALSGIMYNC
jgi:hypothetical protein